MDLEMARAHNDAQGINRLPLELLSGIFLLGEDVRRRARLTSSEYSGFQDLIAQVCRHWRLTAIQTQELWTYIFIAHPPPHKHAELYLSRSGACPIHLDLDLRSSYLAEFNYSPESEHAARALETLNFIISRGGGVHRWSSLIILAKAPLVLSEALSLFNSAPTPAQRFVSLKWKTMDNFEEEMTRTDRIDPSHVLVSGPRRPQFGTVELNCLPCGLLFNRAEPLVSNLRRLKLVCNSVLYPIRGVSAMLSSCPRLETLCLDMGMTFEGIFERVPVGSCRVSLPLLRFLTLGITISCDWTIHMLQIIDAPEVESLQIDQHLHGPDTGNLVNFLCHGRIRGVLQDTLPTQLQPPSGPIFPSLRNLDLKQFNPEIDAYIELLGAYSMIAQATLNITGLMIAIHAGQLLPNLTHVRYGDSRTSEFATVLKNSITHSEVRGTHFTFLEVLKSGKKYEVEESEDDFLFALDGLADRVGRYEDEDWNPTDSDAWISFHSSDDEGIESDQEMGSDEDQETDSGEDQETDSDEDVSEDEDDT